MKYTHVYTLFLLFVFHTSYGQNQTDSVRSETRDIVTSYGPNSMVRNVKKGKNGTILIAALRNGVFRYDGKSFVNLTSKIGLRRFWDVLEDRSGKLWFATTDSGVYSYNSKSFQHFTTTEGLANNAVMRIYEDKAGIIWFGTGGGISRYDGSSFQNFTTKEGLSNNNITTIMEDKTGKLWIGTRGEACFYDGKTFTIFKNKEGKTFNNVWSIIEDRKGNIWFGASIIKDKKDDTVFVENGLWRYDGSGFTKVTQKGASAIIEDKKGNIWTTGAVNPNGVGLWTLSRYDEKSLYDKKPAVTEITSIEKMLCGIFDADDGGIWFGSMNGVYRYDGKNITDFKNKEGQQ
jgi:ligand-binding sensor domain-containing protein